MESICVENEALEREREKQVYNFQMRKHYCKQSTRFVAERFRVPKENRYFYEPPQRSRTSIQKKVKSNVTR